MWRRAAPPNRCQALRLRQPPRATAGRAAKQQPRGQCSFRRFDRGRREFHDFGQRHHAGLGRADIPDGLRVELPVARIDHGQHRRALRKDERGGGERSQRGDADGGFAGRERNTAGRRHADAQAREASWPDGHGDAIEVRERNPGVVHHMIDRGEQRFGMAAPHRHGGARQDSVPAIKHRYRARGERGIEREDIHRVPRLGNLSTLRHPQPDTSKTTRLKRHIGRTSTTSGT